MPKAMIITVGAQGKQIVFSLKKLKPEYLGFLATNTKQSKDTVDMVVKECNIPATKYEVRYCEDEPSEIGSLINKFNEIYLWLTETEKIPSNEISVDPTGGRKWMSSGATMIASFLGLNMIYVDVQYNKDTMKPDPSTMEIIPLGNAYEQTGFLEEAKADKLFNEYSFLSAIEIYNFLSEKISDTNKVETIKIKKCIAKAYMLWTQFKFQEAYEWLTLALQKINQFRILKDKKEKLQKHHSILDILKKNDEILNNQRKYTYFQLLKDNEFPNAVILSLYSLQNHYAEKSQFDQAVIVLYRILEFISQYRLAQYGIDTGDVSEEIRQQYNEKFKEITKNVFQAESEIRDKIGLLESWILLFCIEDKLVEKDTPELLKGLRKNTAPRNLLWLEHKNETVDEKKYTDFKRYVETWLVKILPEFANDVKDFEFIKL